MKIRYIGELKLILRLRWGTAMGKSVFIALAILTGIGLLSSAAHAEKRVALVIGNNDYVSLPKLGNAVADARAVTQALEQLGFRVFKGENLDYKAANRLHADFESAVSPGDTAFVFFAGHGVALGGENYLLPTDMTRPRSGEENLVRSEAHSVDTLVRRVQGRGAATSFFVIDACRDNPFETVGVRSVGTTRGLARMDAPTGVFVLFSAGIGQTALDRLSDSDKAANSVFVRTFVPLLVTPGLTHIALAKRVQSEVKALALSAHHQQQPAFYDQIDGEVVLKEGTPAAGTANTVVAARQTDRDPQAALADVAARVTGAVVKLKVRTPPPPAAAGQKADNKPREGNGSGFIVDPSGGVVTSANLVADALEITATLSDGTVSRGEVVGRDSKTGLALVQIRERTALPTLKFGDSEALRMGQRVVTIGHPYALDSTMAAGMVTGLKRDFNTGPYDEYIQTDIIFTGMAGSPLLNLDGEVVGVNTATYGASERDKIGLAVPSRLAVPVIDQLRHNGRVSRGWLGVRTRSITRDTAEGLWLTDARGALVTSVDEKGPASAAGLLNGDIIVRLNGNDVKDSRDVSHVTEQMPPGTRIELAILRRGNEVTRTVTLMPLPGAGEITPAAASAGPRSGPSDRNTGHALGLELSSLTPSLVNRYSIKSNVRGVVVTDVAAQSDAASKNLAAGDVIVEIAGTAVASPDELQRGLAQAKAEGRKAVLLLIANASGDLRFVALSIR